MFEFLFEPFLFMLAIPAIIWQVFSDKEKRDFLEDIGIALLITLLLVAFRYGL